jgi:hypothetical protein
MIDEIRAERVPNIEIAATSVRLPVLMCVA